MEYGILLVQYCTTFYALMAIVEGISILWHEHSSVFVVGTIVDLTAAVPGSALLTAKMASFRYPVDGREYTSENRIRVPASCEVGQQRPIRYSVRSPKIIFPHNIKRFLAFGCAAAVFFLIGRLLNAQL